MLTLRLCGGMRATSTPSSRIRPAVGCSKPATSRSVVVLPQPEGPSREKNSPLGDVRGRCRPRPRRRRTAWSARSAAISLRPSPPPLLVVRLTRLRREPARPSVEWSLSVRSVGPVRQPAWSAAPRLPDPRRAFHANPSFSAAKRHGAGEGRRGSTTGSSSAICTASPSSRADSVMANSVGVDRAELPGRLARRHHVGDGLPPPVVELLRAPGPPPGWRTDWAHRSSHSAHGSGSSASACGQAGHGHDLLEPPGRGRRSPPSARALVVPGVLGVAGSPRSGDCPWS